MPPPHCPSMPGRQPPSPGSPAACAGLGPVSSRPGWGWDAALPPQAAALASPSSLLALGGLVRGWRPLAYGGCLLGVQSAVADPVHGRSSDCVPPRGSPLQAKPKGLPGTRDGDSQPRPSQGGGGLENCRGQQFLPPPSAIRCPTGASVTGQSPEAGPVAPTLPHQLSGLGVAVRASWGSRGQAGGQPLWGELGRLKGGCR